MTEPGPAGQVVLYRSEDGRTKLDVLLEGESVWLSQRQLTELFGKAKGTISEHIKHIFDDSELDPAATVRRFRTVQREGSRNATRVAMSPIRIVGFSRCRCAWQPRGSCSEHQAPEPRDYSELGRAGEGIRTLDVNLGKVALYH